ncbi:MAG: hypothetical protein IKV80_08425 [Bacteroidales bacterium]|nr:hypothetical protein [Bacteroidales bacterium]
MKIPEYIYDLLYKYGNAYMSPMLIAKCGGIDAVIAELRIKGYNCEAVNMCVDEGDPCSARKRKVIDTIIRVRQE